MLILHTESSHGWGGQEIRILTESRELMKRGHEVIVLADEDSLIAQRGNSYGVRVEHARLKKKRVREIVAMISALNRIRPDVINTHSSTDHWVAAIARRFSQDQVPIIRTRHVSAPVGRDFFTRWLYRKGCEAIVTTGESIRISLTQDGFVSVAKVHSIPTGIDLNFFRPEQKLIARQRIKLPFAVDPKAIILGNIATLRSWKGHRELLLAFAPVARSRPDVFLLIVGDGPQSENLRALTLHLKLEDRVIFAGHQHDVRDYFDALDIFVFPSYANEGVPQAILQAMAYGLPIITTSAGSIDEAIRGYSVAQIIAKQDINALSLAIDEAINAGPRRVSLNPEIRDRIDLCSMATRMEVIYQRVENASQENIKKMRRIS